MFVVFASCSPHVAICYDCAGTTGGPEHTRKQVGLGTQGYQDCAQSTGSTGRGEHRHCQRRVTGVPSQTEHPPITGFEGPVPGRRYAPLHRHPVSPHSSSISAISLEGRLGAHRLGAVTDLCALRLVRPSAWPARSSPPAPALRSVGSRRWTSRRFQVPSSPCRRHHLVSL